MKTLDMKRNILVSILAVMLLTYSIQGISYGQDAPDTIAEFKDINLANAVRDALNLPTGDGVDILKIPKAELIKLTTLEASHKGIVDLTGLEHATQLTELRLTHNDISDLTALTQLTQLRKLYLSNNKISNLTPLAGMILLRDLHLMRNLITDVTPLARLRNLEFLFLISNNISDLTSLAQLPEQLQIYATYNPIDFQDDFQGSPSDIYLITVSTPRSLVGFSLNGSSVTLTLLPSGTSFDASTDNIRKALTVSGVEGATISDVIRVNDTKVEVTLAFTGSLQDNAVLIFSLGEDAVSGYEGRVLTGNHIPVYAKAPLTVSTTYPLKEAMLDGIEVTLTLTSGTFDHGRGDFRDALMISGIPGITYDDSPLSSIIRVSDTQRRITLRFKGNIEADAVLTFTLGAKAIEYYAGQYYNGPAFTAELPVTATVKGLRVLIPELQQQPMFWVNTNIGKIETTEPFDAVTNRVTVLTVDRSTKKVYWDERGENGATIKRAEFDGTNVEELVSLSSVPLGIAIDAVGDKLYWLNSDSQIQTATLDGENISTVIQLEEEIVEETIEDLTSPTDIAVNIAGGRLYWTEFSGRIRRVNLDGTGHVTLLSNIGSPYGITVADDKVYWAEEIDERHGKIQRANFNGTNIETLATFQGLPTGISADTFAGKVYWANSLLGEIQRTDINGGEVETVVAGITAPGDLVFVPGAQQAVPTTPTTTTTDAVVNILPASVASPATGDQITFNLNIADGDAVAGYQATVHFDDTVFRYVSSANGDFLPTGAYFVKPKVEGNLVKLNAASLLGEVNGDGTLATLTFEVIAAKASALTLSNVLLSNSAGHTFVPKVENATTESIQLKGDVNSDGTVNIADLVLVVSNIGETGQNAADVNSDGTVNITDLVLVAGALGNCAASPSLHSQSLEMFTAAEVEQWLSQAQQLNLTDATSLQGILFLQQLLTVLTPKKTTLLANYPNPFNPETWIPYQLAKDSDVTLHIYAMNGTLVRTLSLGHQAAGLYQNRSRAAYWDGRNSIGEKVATGVYFYTLTAGDFSATRKMVIRK